MLRQITPRVIAAIALDLVMTAAAIVASFYIRFEEVGLAERFDFLIVIVPFYLMWAAVVYWFCGLYNLKWRFTSLHDFWNLLRAVSVLSFSLLVLDYLLVSPRYYGTFFFGKITIVLYFFVQFFFLSGPRVGYRLFHQARTTQKIQSDAVPILVVGRAADADVLLRAIESGAVKKVWPHGILSPSFTDQGQSLRGIPVRGRLDDLESVVADLKTRGTSILRLVLTPSAMEPQAHPEALLMRARQLGLATSRLPSLDGLEMPRLAPIEVEDLLLRPSVRIDYARLEEFIRGKAIVVTGGGGSIGSEICDRVVTFGAGRLLIVENSEPALHGVLEQLRAKSAKTQVDGRLADIRSRDRIFQLMEDFKPNLVFHAAALKHVPLLERDWSEGIETNVFGSVNVADAAVAAGATAMVMISTDKAIEPVSILGVTKRLAEMYCQSLDSIAAGDAGTNKPPIRLLSVRFGNVLASNGSVVPKFKAQIAAGGPVTVTDRNMVRYFMTIREACDLVVTAAAHALQRAAPEISVYVLNMGQPVRIVDLAERMIRLSGLEPGRDIDIVYTGARPGERLNEILFAKEEPVVDIGIPGVVAAKPLNPSMETMQSWLAELRRGLDRGQQDSIVAVLGNAMPTFAARDSCSIEPSDVS